MTDLKKKVEAILFSVGRYISLEEISRLCRAPIDSVKDSLVELKVEFETERDSPLVILSDGDLWKMTTREEYSRIVRQIVTETELTKSQLETLAIIAFKYPIKQADLIKIRTNKAYDHLMELEKAGYITRQRYGRSRLIKLTDKFFEYFDLPQEKLKERFKGFEDLAKTIETKDDENKKLREEQIKMLEEAKKQEEHERKVMSGEVEIDLIDRKGHAQKLEIVDEGAPEIGEDGNRAVKLGNLEVVDEPVTEEKKKDESTESIAVSSHKSPDVSERIKKDVLDEDISEEKDDETGAMAVEELFGEKGEVTDEIEKQEEREDKNALDRIKDSDFRSEEEADIKMAKDSEEGIDLFEAESEPGKQEEENKRDADSNEENQEDSEEEQEEK